jgi:hypothetical protein
MAKSEFRKRSRLQNSLFDLGKRDNEFGKRETEIRVLEVELLRRASPPMGSVNGCSGTVGCHDASRF